MNQTWGNRDLVIIVKFCHFWKAESANLTLGGIRKWLDYITPRLRSSLVGLIKQNRRHSRTKEKEGNHLCNWRRTFVRIHGAASFVTVVTKQRT